MKAAQPHAWQRERPPPWSAFKQREFKRCQLRWNKETVSRSCALRSPRLRRVHLRSPGLRRVHLRNPGLRQPELGKHRTVSRARPTSSTDLISAGTAQPCSAQFRLPRRLIPESRIALVLVGKYGTAQSCFAQCCDRADLGCAVPDCLACRWATPCMQRKPPTVRYRWAHFQARAELACGIL